MPTDDLRARADRILKEALETPAADRPALLDRRCNSDSELRELVEELLSYVDDQTERLDPEGALGEVLRSPDLIPTPESAPRAGEMFGAFRLVRKLGEGGMGEVWEADQDQPVQRRVALKLLRPGLRGASIVARFESERQALAMMQHPSIAQVYDAGTKEDRPFLVMELVPGLPITAVCEEKKLSRADRLRLFMKLCSGVQHAHRRGLIHRDLKPSNVLVVDHEGELIPKIIDFGLAKPTEGTLAEETMTLDGQVIGTPAYMSPEQTRPSAAGIDTRTDVYALGTILYELLAGTRPHGGLTGVSIDEVLRTIREVDPPLPSLTTSSSGRALRGDLDWIVMKALAKERERRYESPADLSADLQRHLDGQPVEAGPPTVGYRLGKFVRRHTLAAAGVAILFVLLTTFSFTLGLQNRRIARERDRANEEAEVATAVSDFLVTLFQGSNPEEGAGKDVTALEILNDGADRVNEELELQPEVQVRVMQTMGQAFGGLGDYDRSAELLEKAVEISSRVDARSLEHVVVLGVLAITYDRQGKYAEAERIWNQALQAARSLPERDLLQESSLVNSLGLARWRQGDREGAREHFLEAADLQESVNPRHPELPRALNNLAILSWQDGDFATAREYLGRALSIWEETLGPMHPHVASTIANLALVHQESGDNEGSIPHHERALAIREETLGADHPDVAETLNNLANATRDLGRPEEALQLLDRALVIRESALGPDHNYTATTVYNIGNTLVEMGRWSEARPYQERALESFERSLGPEHAHTAYPLVDLAQIHAAEGNADEARRLFVRSVEIRRAALSPGNSLLGKTLTQFSEFERGVGNVAAADSLLALVEGASGATP